MHRDLALAVAQRRLQRVHDALAPVRLDPQAVEHDRDHAVLGVEPRLLDAHRQAALEHAPEARLLERLAHDPRRDLRPDAVREASRALERPEALAASASKIEDGVSRRTGWPQLRQWSIAARA